MMVIDNKYEIGQAVYLKTDAEQLPRIVIHLFVYMRGEIIYSLKNSTEQTSHYEFEISAEKDVALATNG